MDTLLGILVFVLFIALIIGLVKPQLIMFWSKKPTRIKVFGWWILFTFLFIFIAVSLDTDASKIKNAKEKIENGFYAEAINKLSLISVDSELYLEADSLLNYAQEQWQIEQDIAAAEKAEAEEQKRLATLEEKKVKLEEEKTQKIEQLEKEINSINNGVDFSTYRGSVELIQMEIVLFNAWATVIEEALSYEDPEVQRLGNSLKQKVQNIQIKEFPKLRKAYKDAIYKDLWVENIETAVFGAGNTTIQFTGGVFADNKAKQQTQETLSEILHMLRFKRANYKWYEYDDEYTYYTMKSPKDSEIVTLK